MLPTLIKPQTADDVTSLVGTLALSLFAVIIVTALYVGREIFVPVALAILLSFVLASPVSLLHRMRVPRGIAVVGVVLFAFAIIFALGSLIATQLNRLAGDRQRYQTTIQSKIQSVCGIAGGSSTLERAAGMLKPRQGIQQAETRKSRAVRQSDADRTRRQPGRAAGAGGGVAA